MPFTAAVFTGGGAAFWAITGRQSTARNTDASRERLFRDSIVFSGLNGFQVSVYSGCGFYHDDFGSPGGIGICISLPASGELLIAKSKQPVGSRRHSLDVVFSLAVNPGRQGVLNLRLFF